MNTNLSNIQTQGALAAESYKNHTIGNKVNTANGEYEVVMVYDNSENGFSGTVFKKSGSDEYTIAYRGNR